MFGWLKPESALDESQRQWIDQRFFWLFQNFGKEPLNKPIVTPTPEFFPDPYRETLQCAANLFERVCTYMEIERDRIDLEFYSSGMADDVAASFNTHRREYALGAYVEQEGVIKIWIEQSRLQEVESLASTMSHELSHVHLLSDGRCNASLADHEQLTDLLTVFFGMGIFTANSTLREKNWSDGMMSGWSIATQGYLSINELAYALAVYADSRDELTSNWKRHLRSDIKALFTVELDSIRQGKTWDAVSGLERLQQRLTREFTFNPDDLHHDENQLYHADVLPLSTSQDAETLEHFDCEESGLSDADELFSHGLFLNQQRDFESAIEALSSCLELSPEDAEVWMQRGHAYMGLKQYSNAVDDYTQSLKYNDNIFETFCERARAYIYLNRYSDAIADARRAIKLDPDNQSELPFYLCGLAELGEKNFKAAVKYFNSAIVKHPRCAEFYFARSKAYEGMGNAIKEKADFEEAIRRDSDFVDSKIRNETLTGRVVTG